MNALHELFLQFMLLLQCLSISVKLEKNSVPYDLSEWIDEKRENS